MPPIVVIVDDRATNRNIFARLAGSIGAGVAVRTFGDPVEALGWLAANPSDLLISDYKMPQMNGAEFVRRFRAMPSGTDVPVIVITAYDDRSFRLEALEAGATDFLQTPVDHSEFQTRARNLLTLRRQQDVIRNHARALERELADSERSREALLRDSREALAQVIDTVPALISAADRAGRLVFVNALSAARVGSSPAELAGRDTSALFGAERAERGRALDRLVFEGGDVLPSFEEEVVGPEGIRRVYLTAKAPLRDGCGRVASVLTTSLDITDRKVAEEHLRHLSHHDALTGLPNRVLLREQLERGLARGPRDRRGGGTGGIGDGGESCRTGAGRRSGMLALHLLDLDRFKAVNDALGHHIGDRLLQDVGRRLRKVVRGNDTVARLGGDEFAILQTNVAGSGDAAALAARVVDAVAEPFSLDGHEVGVGASVGVTLHPRDGTDADELLRNADMAMYRAKAAGRNAYRFFTADMRRRAREAMLLDTDLRRGLGREQFALLYQPQVSLRTGRIVGVEALVRWRRPGWGMLAPADFLPACEENGLIVVLGEWVLREACAQAAVWREAGLAPLRVAVNVSAVQLRKHNVGPLVSQALGDTGLDPSLLELELTEGTLIENADEAEATLRELKQLGVRISVDDFGTGYSSLSYVQRFPVDRLKIDRSFIRNVTTEPGDLAIARAVINLGHSLGLQVTAEGVETAEQLARMMAEGCDEIQGYYFSEPLPAEELRALVERGRGLPPAA